MLNKDKNGFYVINKPEDFNELKSRDKFVFKCKRCNNSCYAYGYRPHFLNRYSTFLCRKCTLQTKYNNKTDEEKKLINFKRSKTNLAKYGGVSPVCNKEIQNKGKCTKLKKYGDENYNNSKKMVETKKNWTKEQLSNFSNKFKNTWNNKTCYEKQQIKDKRSSSFKNKSPEEKQKIYKQVKQTKLNRYGYENYNNSKKMVETKKNWSNERRKIYKNRIKQSLKTRSKEKKNEQKEKTIQTNIKKYGNPNYRNFKKIAKTCIEKYGNNTYLWSNKYFKDMLSKFGTTHANAVFDYYNVTFNSSYELAVWIYCIDHNIPIVREPCILYYEYDNKKYRYIPDFMINEELVEIKGDQYVDKYTGKWKFPYTKLHHNSNKLSKEEKEYYDNLYEAKRQCALSNSVRILYNKDILPYIDYCNLYYPNWDNIYRKDNYYNPSYWVYYINNTYIPNYYNNSNYIKGIGISPYDIDKDSDYTICGKGISPFDINKNSE